MFTECHSQLQLGKIVQSEIDCTIQSIPLSTHSIHDQYMDSPLPSILNVSCQSKIQSLRKIPQELRQILSEICQQILSLKNQTNQIVTQILANLKNWQRDPVLDESGCRLLSAEEELRFISNQFNIQRNDLLSSKQFYAREVSRLRADNEALIEENFTLAQKVMSAEKDCQQQIVLASRKLREEYQVQCISYELDLKQEIEMVLKSKDDVIEELKRGIFELERSQGQEGRKGESGYFFREKQGISRRQMQSPATSAVDLLPYLQERKLEKCISLKGNQNILGNESNEQSDFKSKTLISIQQMKPQNYPRFDLPISPIHHSRPRHTRNLTSFNPQSELSISKPDLRNHQRMVSPRGSKVNLRTIQKDLQELSSKLRQQLTSMNSVKR